MALRVIFTACPKSTTEGASAMIQLIVTGAIGLDSYNHPLQPKGRIFDTWGREADFTRYRAKKIRTA